VDGLLAITGCLIWLLVKALRWVLRRSAGNAPLRAVKLMGYGLGLFLLWSGSRVAP
jgi:hypothetical protein